MSQVLDYFAEERRLCRRGRTNVRHQMSMHFLPWFVLPWYIITISIILANKRMNSIALLPDKHSINTIVLLCCYIWPIPKYHSIIMHIVPHITHITHKARIISVCVYAVCSLVFKNWCMRYAVCGLVFENWCLCVYAVWAHTRIQPPHTVYWGT